MATKTKKKRRKEPIVDKQLDKLFDELIDNKCHFLLIDKKHRVFWWLGNKNIIKYNELKSEEHKKVLELIENTFDPKEEQEPKMKEKLDKVEGKKAKRYWLNVTIR